MWVTNMTDYIKKAVSEFRGKFVVGIIARNIVSVNFDAEDIEKWLTQKLEQLAKELAVAHRTKDGWCCACDYDQAILQDKLRHLAKQKDEEFMGMLEDEDEQGTLVEKHADYEIRTGYTPDKRARNQLRSELRNKLQGEE